MMNMEESLERTLLLIGEHLDYRHCIALLKRALVDHLIEKYGCSEEEAIAAVNAIKAYPPNKKTPCKV